MDDNLLTYPDDDENQIQATVELVIEGKVALLIHPNALVTLLLTTEGTEEYEANE